MAGSKRRRGGPVWRKKWSNGHNFQIKALSAHRQGESYESSPIVSAMASAFFPYGLRVLAVDDDRAFLKILEKMLKKCSYEG